MDLRVVLISIAFLFSCKSKIESIHPQNESITESIYASGIVKSKNQYQAFASVNGIIKNVFINQGDTVKKGTPILSIANDAQRLGKENAKLAADYSDITANQGKLNEALQNIEFSKSKLKNDSSLFYRQQYLWKQQIGSKLELEQRELAYQNSKNAYYSSILKYKDLKRLLDFNSAQAKKNLLISSKLESDYILKSEIDGIIYSFDKSKGEIVNPQTAIAIIGDANRFVLVMQVDENDIIRIKKNLVVLLSFDSYKGKVFEAKVTKINPIMNERSKTFEVEAEFIEAPVILYPNLSFEANIVVQTKENALLIPRNFTKNDSIVYLKSGIKKFVRTGLKDYQKIEILSGLSTTDELIKPKE